MRHQSRNPAALPSDPPVSNAAILHELIEALTALGLFLDVCLHAVQKQAPLMPDGLDQITQKSLGQYDRSVAAVRQLQDQLRRDTAIRPLRQLRVVGS